MKNNLQDSASERAVLAALCQYGLDCYLEIDFVDADHFTSDMNQLLYHCIYKSVSENSKVERFKENTQGLRKRARRY